MLARGFQDEAWGGGGGQGWEDGGGEGDVEWYEDDAREMEGFGWNHVWRRGERGDLGAVGGGDGLDEGLRTLARKVGGWVDVFMSRSLVLCLALDHGHNLKPV